MTLGELLKERREELGKSRNQLVQDCGGGLNLQRIEERGIKKPSAETLVKLVRGYNIPLEKLQEFSTIPLKDVKVVFKEGQNQKNIMPLIQAISACGESDISIEDIMFLLQVQDGLRQTITPDAVKQLLRLRNEKE